MATYRTPDDRRIVHPDDTWSYAGMIMTLLLIATVITVFLFFVVNTFSLNSKVGTDADTDAPATVPHLDEEPGVL